MPGVCPRCLREVYFAEEKLALGKVWHNFCFSCRNCRKLLDSWTVATHSGELFCRNCHNRLFSVTSVRTALPAPRISHILPPVDKADPAALSPCDSLSDCCCCCCCNEDPLLIDPQNQDFEIFGSSASIHEKHRLRGGRDEEPREPEQISETGAGKRSSESETSKLGARSSVDIIDEPPSSTTAAAPWYNRQQSASQSVVSHPPSSVQQLLVRPSSTPAPAQAVGNLNASTCSAHRRPGNPCRTNHGHSQYSKHCQRYRCYDSQNSDRGRASQEHGKIIRVCQGRNFVQNYRNCLSRTGRSLSTLIVQSEPKAPIEKPLAKNPITIDSPRPKSSYPPLPPHHSPPPSRRRVSFRPTKATFFKDTSSCHPAMQNIVDPEERRNVDIISFEHTSYQDERSPTNNDELPANYAIGSGSGTDINARDGHSECESCDDERIRGGCGGGSGCCCGSTGPRTSPTLRHQGQSPCGKRYQAERGSTVEGACGCSGRARSGCRTTSGGCCSAGSDAAPGRSARSGGCRSSGYEGSNEGACTSKDPCARRPTGRETCPPRSADSCSTDPSSLSSCSTSACSPPCSGRKGCCPPAGCRPVRRRIDRCNTPCTGDTQSCGGGGCCGGGCRGGCGKPGQTCLPLRPCTTPPCKPHPQGGGSPCMPPRRCAPQPPCCRSPVLPGSPGGASANRPGSGCCRSASPVGRSAGGGGCPPIPNCQQQQEDAFNGGSCCSPKLPAGCECLGGGLDCQRCGRKVYQAEMQIASGVPYHNICFSCFCCRKPLETLTYHENCGEIYCKQCYVRNFGPQGYGYSGVLQTPM